LSQLQGPLLLDRLSARVSLFLGQGPVLQLPSWADFGSFVQVEARAQLATRVLMDMSLASIESASKLRNL